MKIAILTSSRADYGVYKNFIKEINSLETITLELIVFGTHLSELHGHTINEIIDDNITISHKISTVMADHSEESIATSFSITLMKFTSFWKTYGSDYKSVLCLGDRYEMSAAVLAGSFFNISFVHLYGGDYTKGAFDNLFRNVITFCSNAHFTSTKLCTTRVKELIESREHEEHYFDEIGILSLLKTFTHSKKSNFNSPFNNKDYILGTIHSETNKGLDNKKYAKSLCDSIEILSKEFNFLFTLSNSDTYGNYYRDGIIELTNKYPNKIKLVDNLGVNGYFDAVTNSSLVLGNSSSGLTEVASFGKYCINIGDRQLGRAKNNNVIDVPFNSKMIVDSVNIYNKKDYNGENFYYHPEGVKN